MRSIRRYILIWSAAGIMNPPELLQIELGFLEQLLDPVQEAVGRCAVDGAVVVGERQVHDRADHDRVLAVERRAPPGRFTISPMRRIPTCGWLMIAKPYRFPWRPGFETVKVPPFSSSAESFFGRARAAERSSIAAARPDEREPVGVAHHGHDAGPSRSRPRRRRGSSCFSTIASSSTEALRRGNSRSARTVACTMNGRKVSAKPCSAWNALLVRGRAASRRRAGRSRRRCRRAATRSASRAPCARRRACAAASSAMNGSPGRRAGAVGEARRRFASELARACRAAGAGAHRAGRCAGAARRCAALDVAPA